MKKWQKLVGEKAQVEQQSDKILTAIKTTKLIKSLAWSQVRSCSNQSHHGLTNSK